VEILLENEQAVKDMKLLLKLCYSGSYIKDGDELLDRSTRIRLAFWGNAFEMEECVRECLEFLVENMTSTDALTILDDVPRELHGHKAMKSVTAKVVDVLADKIDKMALSGPPIALQKHMKENFANALAKALGPVANFLLIFSWRSGKLDSFYTCLPLKPHVLALSPTVMEAPWESDALDVTTENEVFTLLSCWIDQGPLTGYRELPSWGG